ncbi:adenine phosphoribosyltransferase [Iocasia frigidifontis]|uniref:Adenine phosphoribosyltransferase n=1 Tax=Iocasia fonsfrigidae TaxID=2682810 RepID=A0A8A7KGJ4_9FIRM|nr:adenine phosphoribosyltransferase [Iocasia fonsfrigidae]QTL98007.1 adenine phosphoribosyltransferase [Iocasia fonsfrigidae]
MNLKETIRNIPDFPKEGVIFKDITTMLKDPAAFKEAIDHMAEKYKDCDIDYVVGIEARGFILGAPIALALNKGFIPVRKPGKLPAETVVASYELEYGTNQVEMHQDAITEGDKVLIIDDLLATGGTVSAAVDLVERLGGEVIGIGFLLELCFLKGRDILSNYDVFSLLQE